MLPVASPTVLGIESSCDETAAAVVRGGRDVLSDVVATQHELHERYKGVVPEIASRAHVERILPVVREALRQANLGWEAIDAVAVGHRPGLIGSLLVGVAAAKAIAWSLSKPFLGVDHVAAHLFSGLLDRPICAFPALGLVVSGGHTSLYRIDAPTDLHRLGGTIDDAIGEAFDKAATILGLGYPGGPKLDALARRGDDRAHAFPVPYLGKDSEGERRLDFSFSGLKTSLLYAVRGVPDRTSRGREPHFPRSEADLDEATRANLAASFERVAVGHVMRNLERALDRQRVGTLLVGGGASANTRLRQELATLAGQRSLDLRLPQLRWCLDNAAMIAGYAAFRVQAGESDPLSLAPDPLSALR